jgi:hypothetical protein
MCNDKHKKDILDNKTDALSLSLSLSLYLPYFPNSVSIIVTFIVT